MLWGLPTCCSCYLVLASYMQCAGCQPSSFSCECNYGCNLSMKWATESQSKLGPNVMKRQVKLTNARYFTSEGGLDVSLVPENIRVGIVDVNLGYILRKPLLVPIKWNFLFVTDGSMFKCYVLGKHFQPSLVRTPQVPCCDWN